MDDAAIKRDHYDRDSRVSHNVDVAVNCNVNSSSPEMRDLPSNGTAVSIAAPFTYRKNGREIVLCWREYWRSWETTIDFQAACK